MLVEIYQESIDLPENTLKAILKDCLLDICLNDSRWDDVGSSQDLIQYCSSVVTENIIIDSDLEKISFIRGLAVSLELYYTSKSVSQTERLVKALEKGAGHNANPDIQHVVISGNKIAVRCPDFENDNLGHIDNLGKYLKWATTILGMTDPEIKFIRDPAVGKGIQLTARVERMMDNTIAALTLPPAEAGDRAEFKNGFKANLVELLAATRLLRRYSGALQKGKAPKGQKLLQVTLEDLKKSVNARAGITEKGVSDFTIILVKAVFNELTKPNSKRMPGVWIHSLKQTNGVKNNIGVIYKLGYETKVVNAQKALTVVHHDVVLKDNKVPKEWKKKVSDKETFRFGQFDTEQKKLLPELEQLTKDNSEIVKVPELIRSSMSTTHQEFRLGAFMLLPLIDPKDARSPKDQISIDPLAIRDRNVLGFYSQNRDVVDALNLAYATMKAVGRKNSKATTLGYLSARGHALQLTANREWMDRTGKKYQGLNEIPKHVAEFLLKLLHRKINVKETEAEEIPLVAEQPAEDDVPTPTIGEGLGSSGW